MSEDKKVKRPYIPTDAQVIREFIAEADIFEANYEGRMTEGVRGNIEVRRALASRLEYVRNQRADAVQEAAQQVAAAIAKAGESLAQRLKVVDLGNKTEK